MNNIVMVENTELTNKQTVSGELFNRWTSYVDASPKTIETYKKSIKQFLIYLQDNGITQPRREDVLAYREYLKESHKPTTVQAYIAAVKLFFKWTEQEGLYPNISNHIKGAKVDAKEHKKDYLTTRQTSKLLEAIDRSSLKGKRDYALLCLMVTTGLRTVSVARANIEDIKTAGNDTVLYYQGKGHEEKAAYVKLASPVEEAVRSYLKARGKTGGEEPLFSSTANRNNGGRMTTRSISRVAKEHLIEIGLDSDRLTAHSLRHTAATTNLLNGGSLEETQQLLDHANINTTLIYVHSLERSKNNSEHRIAKAIFG